MRFLSGLFLIVAAAITLYLASPIPYYLQPKTQRLYNVWSQDVSQLAKEKSFRNMFNSLAKVELHFTDPQVAEEFYGVNSDGKETKRFTTPFKTLNPNGYTLKVSITRWIEKDDYGFVIQHEVFDRSEEKVYEFGRTYKVGKIF